MPAGLSNVVAIAAGNDFSLALEGNGAVVGWGYDGFGEIDVPPGVSNVVAIATGYDFSLALEGNGTVVGWGFDGSGQTNVPPGLTNVVAIAAAGTYSLALESNGTVVAWGDATVPPGLSNVMAVAAGYYFALALEGNGTVVGWGDDSYGEINIPPSLSNVVAVVAGYDFGLALIYQGPPFIVRQPASEAAYSGATVLLSVGALGAPPLSYQWQLNETNIVGATTANLSLAGVQGADSGMYSVVISNSLGFAGSSNVNLKVMNLAPVILAQPAGQTVFSGTNAVFSVAATGSLPLSYQWRFQGTNLPGATSSTLTLLDVTSDQTGDYQSIVTNPYGSVTSAVVALSVVTFSTVYRFGTIQDTNRNALDGAFPYAALVLGTDGSMYGTTSGGGSNCCGLGTVFQMTTNGTLTTLHSFGTIRATNNSALDGAYPYAALVPAGDGSMYGTTSGGGNIYGFGTVFRITTNGTLTTLYSFGTIQDANGDALDGANPYAALVLDSDGSVYGTSSGGGTNGFGAVFRMTANGILTNLYSFGTDQDAYGNPLDGAYPYAALIKGPAGSMYGTTSGNNIGGSANGFGTIFRMTPDGTLTNVYSFGSIQDAYGDLLDGAYPYAPLVLGTDGTMYGTTYGGGSNFNIGFGTVFRITTNGALTTLYSFGTIQDTSGNALDGAYPDAGLISGGDGYYYGTTSQGGRYNNGTLFRITTNGILTTLYQFSGGSDGSNPTGGLMQASDGDFYGTTEYGGTTNGDGTIFRLSISGTISPPLFQSVTQTHDTLTFIWSDVAGHMYQVQFTTNLNQTVWSPLGPPILAGSGTLSASDTITNAQRFYRIVLLP